MMVDQPKYKTSDEVDFLIIGSGAAGGILAKELSTNGFRVVVLEQGPYLTESDFTHNEVEIFAEDKLTNHPKLQPNTFRKTPDEKAKPQRALHREFLALPRNRFHRAQQDRPDCRHRLRGLADHLLGPRAVLHKSRMGNRCLWPRRRQPFRSPSFEALSHAATAGEVFRCDFRARRAQARLASVSSADGNSFAAAPRTERLRQLWLLSFLWLRGWREVQLARYRHPSGGTHRPLRNSSQFLCASHRN